MPRTKDTLPPSPGQESRAPLRLIVFAIALAVVLSSCLRVEPDDLVGPDIYGPAVEALIDTGVAETALGAQWIAAGEQALAEPRQVSARHDEWMNVHPRETPARAWVFTVRPGSPMVIRITAAPRFTGAVFADLSVVRRSGTASSTRHIGSLPTDGTPVSVRSGREILLLVRLQPELLATGRIHVALSRGE